MDRSSVVRFALIAIAVIVFLKFGMPAITGSNDKVQQLPEEKYINAPAFVPDAIDPPTDGHANTPQDGELCKIAGNRFDAELSSRGAAITHFRLHGYDRIDLSTTPDQERWRSLRTLFRGPEGDNQIKYDRFPWALERMPNDTGCTFTYADDLVRIVKKVTAGTRPFELEVETSVTNLAADPKKHQLTIGVYAYREARDMKGSMGRVPPFQTDLTCAAGKEVVRKTKGDFAAGWVGVPSTDRFAAVSSHYFTQALIPSPGGPLPRCEILAEDWTVAGQPHDSDEAVTIFHAKLVFPGKELAPNESTTYKQTAYFAAKERPVLQAAAGGHAKLGDTISLGTFSFSAVVTVLVSVLSFLHDKVTFGNWGVAIILMTIALRLLLFPLTLKSIKTTIAMRKLKPEVDSLNAKFADDAQAKNLAMMELWKKHGVNPFGGCLPQLVQMPVWFAMYTTLQTAVEMYHTRFLWFSDLSAPDRYFILPAALCGLMIAQQRLMPQQGMDPMQQKMMAWGMPLIFGAMMLFLPAALGVYMMTNSLLGIGQQLAVEKLAPRGPSNEITVKQVSKPTDKTSKSSRPPAGELGKGKARV